MAENDPMLNLRGQLPAQLEQDNDASTTLQIFFSALYYSMLIIVMPVMTFFVTKIVVLEFVFEYSSADVKSNVISALAAVAVLHMALFLFIYKAYFQGTSQAKKRIGKQE